MDTSPAQVVFIKHAAAKEHPSMARVGIFAGVFDPVHAGHIAMALQAMQSANLDRLYFLPERKPVHKQGVTHFGHRVAMLKVALRPHPKFGIVELPDVSFSVKRTLPHLQQRFADDQLVFLFGSDRLLEVPLWPHSNRLLAEAELVVGLRNDSRQAVLLRQVEDWEQQPLALTVFRSFAPEVSSGKIREALYRQIAVRGLLQSVKKYSNKNWLYVSVS
jgi:nicotinate-nucleotide adenylyltransferase